MKLEIDYKKITDAPYKKDTDSFFTFTPIEVESFVNLISKMNESSYYLSGFRGVGKTSFIKKVEEELEKTDNFVFIHAPIAKYDKYEILIRSLIRQFYFQFVGNKRYENLKTKNNSTIKDLGHSLENLNKQTFSSIDREFSSTKSIETERELTSVSYKDGTLFFLIALVATVLATVDLGSENNYKTAAQITSIGLTIGQGIKFGYTLIKKHKSKKETKETQKSLYDDEIAEYRFISILKEFKNAGVKPVFILDELDKLPIKEAKNVLYLFKSTLLSGHANFIVIGGQDLYYELYSVNEAEDPILSTLFSKTFHVPLKSSYELRNLFEKLIITKDFLKTDDNRIAYDQYVNWLVLESKKIPRKFLNLIKEELYFENDKAFIDIPQEFNRPANTELLNALDIVCDNISGHPKPIKDYIVINLFNKVDDILNLRTRDELNEYIQNLE
ncbi:MAG: P-loop NTPase fold protein [Bacteroidota bacterium]|nr:P-loop NTPase fold protein [Bacteroidota bacterium]